MFEPGLPSSDDPSSWPGGQFCLFTKVSSLNNGSIGL